MAKKSRTVRELSVAYAVSEAISDLLQLGEEMREWADNLEEKFSGTEKYERIVEAAETLENLDEPVIPGWAGSVMVTITDLPIRKRGYSRNARCMQACYTLDVAYAACEERLVALSAVGSSEWTEDRQEKHQDDIDSTEAYRDAIEEIKDAAEDVDFPGAYG